MEIQEKREWIRNRLLLYGVTDRAWTGKQTLLQQVEAALKGGVTCIQLREKDLDPRAFLEEARQIKQVCRAYQVPFIINDQVEIAVACQADGVHVGQKDREAAQVRKQIGKDRILGVSVQTVEQAKRAQEAGADYLGVGAVFPTGTKQDACEVSHLVLRDICRVCRIPVVAIGGIHAGNIHQLAGTGIDGVALVSAIFGAADIEEACRRLAAASEKITGEQTDENGSIDCRK